MLTVQTAGEAIRFHPHVHGVLADGLFLSDGTFCSFKSIDECALARCFAERVLAALSEKCLITGEVVSQIQSQEHSGFSVWVGEPFVDCDSKRFVARYIERGPVSQEKLSLQGDRVKYAGADGKAYEYDVLEFLALLSTHVAKPYESVTRYYGAWSCRARGRRRKLVSLRETAAEEAAPKPSLRWAACMKRMYEIDPLECPRCKGKMRIIAFLQESAEIQGIMRSLGLPDFRAPPKIPVPAPEGDDLQQMPD